LENRVRLQEIHVDRPRGGLTTRDGPAGVRGTDRNDGRKVRRHQEEARPRRVEDLEVGADGDLVAQGKPTRQLKDVPERRRLVAVPEIVRIVLLRETIRIDAATRARVGVRLARRDAGEEERLL